MLKGSEDFKELSRINSMDEFEIKEIIEEQNEEALKSKLVEREVEKDIGKWMKGEEVIVLTGVRRVGKTSIMFNLLKKYGGVYVNFEDERFFDFSLKDFEKLERITKGNIYLDEIQNIKGWERFVRRIHKKRKVVVSGSNASLLESDFASSLTGRTITFRVYPLSYREFLNFKSLKVGRSSFIKYLELGGFPAVVLKEEKRLLKEYFSAILYRDIKGLNERIERLAFYFLSNVGKPFSYRSLRDFLGVKHEETVRRYVKTLEKAFLINVIHKYDLSLKKRESYEKKVYAVDHGLASLFPRIKDIGRLLENSLLINLLAKGRDVYFYKNKGEVDFLVCEGLRVKAALNICYEVNDSNLNREIKPLKEWEKKVPSKLLYLYKETKEDLGEIGEPVYSFLK